jgi:hypothetical protein
MTRAPLKHRVKSVEESIGDAVSRYLLRFAPNGWAIFYVDHEWGGLTITSDWGSWSYLWGGGPKSWGHPTFLDFVRDRADCNYLADKLSYGRTRDVVDIDETRKALRAEVVRRRREGSFDRHEARELWKDIDRFCEVVDESGISSAYYFETPELDKHFVLYEWLVMETAPKVVFLIEELLPAFVAHLRGELATPADAGSAEQGAATT